MAVRTHTVQTGNLNGTLSIDTARLECAGAQQLSPSEWIAFAAQVLTFIAEIWRQYHPPQPSANGTAAAKPPVM